jgi:hypothetical protein
MKVLGHFPIHGRCNIAKIRQAGFQAGAVIHAAEFLKGTIGTTGKIRIYEG